MHRKTFSYRLYPTRLQALEMQRQLDAVREVYNACLEERREAWRMQRKHINLYDQTYQIREVRQVRPDLSALNHDLLASACFRADRTFKAFYRRCRAGDKPGYPRFKSRQRFDSMTFLHYGHGCKLSDRLYLQGVGKVKVKLHRSLEGKIKTVTVKRVGVHWFAMLSCESMDSPKPVTGETVGIDLGLTHFLTTDAGETVDNPRPLKKAQRKLRVAQRSFARKKRGSQRRRKQRERVAALHLKVRRTRLDFHHKVSRNLVDRFDFIGHEDLIVSNMVKNRSLARSISDAGWTQFISILTSKAAWAARTVVAVNPSGTSQHCICGAYVSKTLKDRWHDCLECGISLPRDQVSAMLILALGHSVRAQTLVMTDVA